MLIYTPVGEVRPPSAARAATVASLAGARIGILENAKPNARLLLCRIAEQIADRTGAEVTMIRSKNAAVAASDAVLDELSKEVELVLTGSAD